MKHSVQYSIALLLLSVIGLLFAVCPASAQTYTLSTLATFNGSNGSQPMAGLILSGGTLYGTTVAGCSGGDGTVFSVPVGGGAVTTLATFNGGNGADTWAGLVLSGGTL